MTDDDIAKARAKIAASPQPRIWDPDQAGPPDVDSDSSYVEGWNDAQEHAATNAAGWSAALDEVERLTKLHAEKHAQNERMCSEIERLDREVAGLRARVTSYDALAVQAADTIDALSAVCDRVATIASESFGPFPVQSAADNLTAIEQGIAKLLRDDANATAERARLLEERAADLDSREDEALRSRERE